MNFEKLCYFLDHEGNTPYSETYVMQDHKTIFHYRTGYDDPVAGARCKPNGFYHIYSCTKPLTVTAAMQLFERGDFVMATPVSEFLPEYAELTVRDAESGELRRAARPLTMGHLFTMTSGLTYDLAIEGKDELVASLGEASPTVPLMRLLAKRPLLFDPGTRFQYGLSHDVLGAVIEVITGQRLGDYLKSEILAPLGMHETGFTLPSGGEARCVTPLEYHAADKTYKVLPFQNRFALTKGYESGGAGIISTPNDYRLLADALASGGVGASGERILSPAAIAMLHQPCVATDVPYLNQNGYLYGYGVRTMQNPALGLSPVGEFGWDGACGCVFLADTKNRLSLFHARYCSPAQNDLVTPRIRNALYSCLN